MQRYREAWQKVTSWLGPRPAVEKQEERGGDRRPAGPGLLNAWRGKDGQLTRVILLTGLAGVLLMLFGSSQRAQAPPGEPTAVPAAVGPSVAPPDFLDYADVLEKELTVTLNQMAGVANVKVFITLASGTEKVFAGDREEERQTVEEGDKNGVTRRTIQERTTQRILTVPDDQGRSQSALVQTERNPPVQGVLIVAEGADDPSTRWLIMQAAQAVLGVSANRVMVVSKRT